MTRKPKPLPTPTKLEDLFDYFVSDTGEVLPRRGNSRKKTQIDREIPDEVREILGREMTLQDVNLDVANMLVFRWQRRQMPSHRIKLRVEWFGRINKLAHHFGLAELQAFETVESVYRKQWWQARRDRPMPEPAPVVLDGTAATMTLSVLFEHHYRMQRLIGKSNSTVRLYRQAVRNYSKWLQREAMVGDLCTATFTECIDSMCTETDLSVATVVREAKRLLALWRFAARKRWVSEFPEIYLPEAPRRVPDAFTPEQLSRLLRACEAQQGTVGEVPAGLYWSALVLVIYDTGERISAVMETDRSQLVGEWLTVRGEHRKGKRRDKRYKLRAVTVERLNAYQSKKLFGWPKHQTYLWLQFGKILEQAGLPNDRRNKFHKIRRTVASHFEAAGGNATELLDHESRKTTQEGYLDPSVIQHSMPADLLPDIASR